ncbi:dihydroxyacetone kinase subunit L [Actinomycetospora endophytica]|uniref:Dihydroxyacetone kinase subunit L n=1 Tax=Actinomycetospora endophytica TaxID=2291215 RepID=A0ABS8PHY7_9PSEU|nr:dihydroxyacetone kinase subunit DhaL [Actinomycetospora endophytica]MCD2197883.1 dihydroxyacetone kinase subunit L [Actinomycetospora endophytica]
MSVEDTEFVVGSIAQTVVENEKYFGDLDAVAGDGDFGYSLARGFEKVLADWDSYDRADSSTFIRKVAMTLSSKIGGTSGPIWGTAFLRAAKAAEGRELDGTVVVGMLRAAVEGIQQRGGAEMGDKTLIDAIVPATDALDEAIQSGATGPEGARTFAAAARKAAEDTAALQARRGRASYTGERSKGSPDPGAVAVAVIAEDLTTRWTQR